MADPVLRRNFRSLSVKDLLDARDQYHVHLSQRDNVVGTAIGLYRIRKNDPDASDAEARHVKGRRQPRTLLNTTVKPWSWPCVLVFVDQWRSLDVLRRHPEEVVPSFLYLPDGRVAPTCVVYAPRDERAHAPLTRLTFPSGAVGGGYPVITDVQGNEHVGSLGCLVSDGDVVYALTSRHVVGEPGREVYTIVRSERQRIGVSDDRQVTKKAFQDVYAGLAGSRSFTNLDAGLIRIDDLRGWTAQVYGLGQLGPLMNIHAANLSMDLVGTPVRAFGAASGALRGQIMGLFYRYRTVGGVDFVADFLIGPREGETLPLRTRPGDSGTIWCWDPPPPGPNDDPSPRRVGRRRAKKRARAPKTPTLRPFGAQWGGQVLLGADGKEPTQFALATNLSQICRALDVDLVRDWGTGLSEYWGKVGHYKVGSKACELVRSAKLRTLLLANQDRIGVSDDDLVAGRLPMNNQPEFVALADVADLVWRAKRKKDQANHFADMDEEGAGAFAGRTLMDLWFKTPALRTPAAWTEFYDALPSPVEDKHRGALPFRVAEIYDAMVGFARAKDVERFVCAAGILAHYLGDACQPLHVSKLHHGRPGHADEANVHSVYETAMLDRRAVELVAGVNTAVGAGKAPAKSFKGGAAAAHAAVELMKKTLKLIPPMEVIDAYNAEEGRRRIEHMWDVLGKRTCKTIARGSLTLAHIWQSAWVEGRGSKIPAAKLVPVSKARLKELYLDTSFLTPNWLKDM